MAARQKPAVEPADEQEVSTPEAQPFVPPNSTFGTRTKAVQVAENKAIGKAETK